MDRNRTHGGVNVIGMLRDETRLLRWGSLLYSVFWFAEPIHRRSFAVWTVFLVFYGIFLTGYLRVLRGSRREQRFWLTVLFLLGYLYYPFNPNAGGEFVFAVVVSSFFLRQGTISSAFRRFAVILAAQAAGLFLETWWLHLPWSVAQSVVFFMVVIGLSNFSFARQVFVSGQLRKANEEIEYLTQQAERERIARDLHDLLGHTLTVIAVKSDVANRLFSLQPDVAHREIAEVEATAREALHEVRSAVTGYRAEGVEAEVSKTRNALGSAGVQLYTKMDFVDLSPLESDLLCFVLREATTNILRHAYATECRVEVSKDSLIRLTIEDDGLGKQGADGNGIDGMRERLRHARGSLVIDGSPLGGMRLLAELPASLESRTRDFETGGRL
ncbi:sensor histidine kinase [Granulicella tundricola]|uniref:Integral membrane sensor signal transduction histidine kinase n=1 Tax=Granulicella tundricola (strain ATCC BAA-1859 / DSM 23138 / MP5ACTX9) TaxID=1198114 RepID=E8X844_GRATM|nr:sensor histidine kinase [Granulicella tundricola]ADW71628.1 integral membrane sensor signal transduction histidine kinase [Granulicella tundricola MP5ACTX9]